MIETLGWIGAILFGICCFPQTLKTLRTGRADDISWLFLAAWTGGEVCMIAYNHLTVNSIQLSVNYYFNLACLLPILWVKLAGGKKEYTDDMPAQYPLHVYSHSVMCRTKCADEEQNVSKYYVVTVYDEPAELFNPLKTSTLRVRYGTYPEFEKWLLTASYLPPAVPRSALK